MDKTKTVDLEKVKALTTYLGCDPSDVEFLRDNEYSADGGEYLVLTEKEADKLVRERIAEDLWAFNTDFVMDHLRPSITDGLNSHSEERLSKGIRKLQEELCEDATPVIAALVENVDEFVQDALDADGRGHFMNSYDGEEHEVKVGEVWYNIYRTN